MKKLNALPLLFCFAALAAADPGRSCFDFLDVPSSARGAVSPLQYGLSSVLANPALAGVEKTALEFSYAGWLGNLNIGSAGFGQRLSDKFSLSAYAVIMNLSETLKAYDDEGIPSGEAEYSNYRYAAALSFRPSNVLRMGLAVMASGEDLDGDAQSAVLPSAGFEMRGRFGFFRRAAALFTDVSGDPDTRFSLWHRASLSKIDYSGEKFSPLSVSEASVTEHIGHLSLSLGLRSSETSGLRAGVKYGFEDIIMECGILSESESDLQISAGVSFEFEPVTVDLSYLTRADAGSSIFSTVSYEFDMPGFVGGIADKAAEKRSEAKRYVKTGSVTDRVSSVSQAGEKEIWINFSSEFPVDGNFVITKDSAIAARGRVIQRLSDEPFLYEGLVMEHEVITEFLVGDTVAVSQKQMKKQEEERQKIEKDRSAALKRRIIEQKDLLKTADLMRWDSSAQKLIEERVSELREKGNLEECDAKLAVLEKSVKKLFEDNIKAMITEAGALAGDAGKVGVNVSYPESLTLKAEGALKKKNYKEALSNISESLKWLHKILEEIENE
ncbi:hypothetical protein KKF70_01065 [bacterium]|nr:hypothetical protein [Candidatus Omnitrophota bacterium]MBU2527963.1 hypothetical protein [bacterium]MBU3930142.1 hypothetical protein [bacterium]MBU4123026.1 hypothetical protein [bacterium]